ncbi:hypothetical protein [Micrococcus luteus]|uniref:hypothetical protein n=1 Tax=Micrococcus luteus TaxID=1270 RepID=UPI0011AF0901|nr:hypothetical protein [Micrococcus luteus]
MDAMVNHYGLKPGQITDRTGPHNLHDAAGHPTGATFWLTEGTHAPPTPASGWRWRWHAS